MEEKSLPARPVETDTHYFHGFTKFEAVKLECLKAILSNPSFDGGSLGGDVTTAHAYAEEFFKKQP